MRFEEVTFDQIENLLAVRAGLKLNGVPLAIGNCGEGCTGKSSEGHCTSGCQHGGDCEEGGCGAGFPKTADVNADDWVDGEVR